MSVMDIRVVVGRNVRKFRDANDLSQEELADLSGLHRTYVSGVERGVRNPMVMILEKLATALGTRPAALLDDLVDK